MAFLTGTTTVRFFDPHELPSPNYSRSFSDFGVSIWGKDFDPEAHEDIVHKGQALYAPTVDVFLPVCNEPLALLANTWNYVLALDYPHVTVHVLDDGAKDEVKALANKYGFECEHQTKWAGGKNVDRLVTKIVSRQP